MLLDHNTTKAIAAARYRPASNVRRDAPQMRSDECPLMTAWHVVTVFVSSARGVVLHRQAR